MVTIRRACLRDVETIIKLWKEFLKQHDEIVMKGNPRLRPYFIRKNDAAKVMERFVIKNIRSRNAIIHVAEAEGKPVGYALSFIKKNNPVYRLERMGHISDLFVIKEYRGLGISSMFKNEAVKWFKRKGVEYISLSVSKENRKAHHIYDRWGFLDYRTEMRMKI
jgi:GNAT superfamily N-acetyltransferase